MPDNVSYKVYLLDTKGGEGSSEVRRFVVDKDVSSSFPYLKEKLATVFPSLRPNVQFDVSWTDEDDDKVTIASDEELIIALTEMPGPVYKLNVAVREGKNPKPNLKEEEANNLTVHPGVTCDGCDKDVRGYRYKCVVCDDYDLCSTCEAAGRHPGHNMMRISSPEVIWPQRMFKRFHKMQERAEQRSRCRSAAQERCEKKSEKQSAASAPPPPGHHVPPPGHGAPPPPPPHHGGAWAGAPTGRGRGMFRGGRGRGFGMGGRCGFGDPRGAWSFGHAGGMGAWAAPAFEAMMRGWMGEQFSEAHMRKLMQLHLTLPKELMIKHMQPLRRQLLLLTKLLLLQLTRLLLQLLLQVLRVVTYQVWHLLQNISKMLATLWLLLLILLELMFKLTSKPLMVTGTLLRLPLLKLRPVIRALSQ